MAAAEPFTYEPAGLAEIGTQARNARFSSIRELSETDISDIWWHTSQFLAAQISKKRGVAIANLGTFTLADDAAQSPTFVLSPDFVQRHGIRLKHNPPTANIPVVPLNFAYISSESKFPRNAVENCIHEIVQALKICLEEEKPIALVFPGVGKLSIKQRKVRFGFYREFLNEPKALDWRPPTRALGTARPVTVGAYGPRGSSRMSSRSGGDARGMTPRLLGTPSYGQAPSGLGATNPIEAWIEDTQRDTEGVPSLPAITNARPTSSGGVRPSSPFAAPESPTILKVGQAPRTTTQPHEGSATSPLQDELQLTQKLSVRNLHTTIEPPVSPVHADSPNHLSKTAEWEYGAGPAALLDDTVKLPAKHKRTIGRSQALETPSDHTHKHGPGGSCYVCFQRSKPDLDPTIKAKMMREEKEEEERVLALAKLKARRAQELEKHLEETKRHTTLENARFNQKAATQRPKTAKDREPKMDVFCFRPSTSHSTIRRVRNEVAQEHLQAAAQVSFTKFLQKKQAKEIEESERRINDAILREEERQKQERKREQQERYREDLKSQIKHKTTLAKEVETTMPAEWDSKSPSLAGTQVLNTTGKTTILGPEQFFDDNERERIRRAREREAYEEQKQMERERRLKAKQERERELEEGRMMLKNAELALKKEMAKTGKHTMETRKELDKSWKAMATMKRERERDELEFRKAAPELVILEQTASYDRCGQCQRGVDNVGKTNVVEGQFMDTTPLSVLNQKV